jgi:hypothetical protein
MILQRQLIYDKLDLFCSKSKEYNNLSHTLNYKVQNLLFIKYVEI